MTIRNIFINIISASTLEWFSKSTSESDIHGGFVPRFLLVPGFSDRFNPLPEPIPRASAESIIQDLRTFKDYSGMMCMDSHTKQAYRHWATTINDEIKKRNPDPLPARMGGYFTKFCMLEAANNHHGLRIETNDVEQAGRQIEAAIGWTDYIREHTGTSRDEALLKKMLAYIPREGIKLGDLMRKLNISKKVFYPFIETLEESDRIERVLLPSKDGIGGRPGTLIMRKVNVNGN